LETWLKDERKLAGRSCNGEWPKDPPTGEPMIPIILDADCWDPMPSPFLVAVVVGPIFAPHFVSVTHANKTI